MAQGKGQSRDTGITSTTCPACGASCMRSNATGDIVQHYKQGGQPGEMCNG